MMNDNARKINPDPRMDMSANARPRNPRWKVRARERMRLIT
jgi:hypothetical protein